MRYDLPLLVEYCAQQGIPHNRPSNHLVEIQLKEGVLLCFQNEEDADDCAVGFRGTSWHTHGDFMFVGNTGEYIEMTYLDTVHGLFDGTVLVCDLWDSGRLVDRWVTHTKYNDDLRYIQPNEELRILRPFIKAIG